MDTLDAVRLAAFRVIARDIVHRDHRLGFIERLDRIERGSVAANATVLLDRVEKDMTALGYFDKDL